MKTLSQRLAEIDTRLKRWRPKLTRAHNEVQKLLRQRERLVREGSKQIGLPVKETPLPELNAFFTPPKVEVLKQIAAADVPAWDAANSIKPLDIPAELRREPERPRAHWDISKPETLGPAIREAAQDAGISEKTKKRLAKNDLKRRGPSRFGTKDMPLSGKAALEAVRPSRKTKS